MIIHAALVVVAYLFGSIASAIIVCKLLGLSDPRENGSGNPGATNVLRLHGKKAAVITLIGDVLKGVIPVLIAHTVQAPAPIIAACGLAAFLGHLFPVFFGFEGGKGVATLVGVISATNWMLGLAYIITWLIVAGIFRYSSLAALTAAILTPVYAYFILHHPAYIFTTIIMCLALIWRHQSNIKNLLNGSEEKIGKKKA